MLLFYTFREVYTKFGMVSGLRYARMLGMQNMRGQCSLTAAVQNIKRLSASFYRAFQAFLTFYLCACV